MQDSMMDLTGECYSEIGNDDDIDIQEALLMSVRNKKRRIEVDEQNAEYARSCEQDIHLRPPSPPLGPGDPAAVSVRMKFPSGFLYTHAIAATDPVSKLEHVVRYQLSLPPSQAEVDLGVRVPGGVPPIIAYLDKRKPIGETIAKSGDMVFVRIKKLKDDGLLLPC